MPTSQAQRPLPGDRRRPDGRVPRPVSRGGISNDSAQSSNEFFLVDEPGPASFVIKQISARGKAHRVDLGERNNCSTCMKPICPHTEFVISRVLRMPERSRAAKATGFSSRQIEDMVRSRNTRALELVLQSGRRDGGHGGALPKRKVSSAVPPLLVAVEPKRLDEDSTCPICQDAIAADAAPTSLVWCGRTCGNFLHRKCLAVWANYKEERGEEVTCPYCREPFQDGSRMQQSRPPSSEDGDAHPMITPGRLRPSSSISSTVSTGGGASSSNPNSGRSAGADNGHRHVSNVTIDDWRTLALDLIESLPRFSVDSDNGGGDGDSCDLCRKPLSGYGRADARALVCGHVFHQPCITQYLLENDGRCPRDNEQAILSFADLTQESDDEGGTGGKGDSDDDLEALLQESISQQALGRGGRVNRPRTLSSGTANRSGADLIPSPPPNRSDLRKRSESLGTATGTNRPSRRRANKGSSQPASPRQKHERQGRLSAPAAPESTGETVASFSVRGPADEQGYLLGTGTTDNGNWILRDLAKERQRMEVTRQMKAAATGAHPFLEDANIPALTPRGDAAHMRPPSASGQRPGTASASSSRPQSASSQRPGTASAPAWEGTPETGMQVGQGAIALEGSNALLRDLARDRERRHLASASAQAAQG